MHVHRLRTIALGVFPPLWVLINACGSGASSRSEASASASALASAVEIASASASVSASIEKPRRELGDALTMVNEALLKEYVSALASDDFEGRNTGFPGQEKAAAYLEDKLRSFDVMPAGDVAEEPSAPRSYRQNFELDKLRTDNVVGMIRGTDPELENEIVVIGAHYDHLGKKPEEHRGRRGTATKTDEIWNGADDNASGTSSVLAIAKVFGEGRVKCNRTLVFVFFSGEEWGLWGSRWYVKHPVAPMSSHVFMLNMDMVGRNPSILVRVEGSGPVVKHLRPVIEQHARELSLKVAVQDLGANVAQNSDHYTFFKQKVPQLFFFTGLHPDYHKVSDEADKIAYPHMHQIVQVAAHVVSFACSSDRLQARPAASSSVSAVAPAPVASPSASP